MTIRPLGDFQTLADHGDCVVVAASRGAVEIAPLAGAVRIRISRRKRLPAYQSLAVHHRVHREHKEKYRVSVNSVLSVVSQNLAIHIHSEPLGLSFSRRKSQTSFAADLTIGTRGEHIVVRKSLHPDDHVYGLGEKTGWLDKRHRKYTMRNADVWWEHPAGITHLTDPLYASFPVFIVHNRTQTYGIFVDNPEFTEFDFTGDEWHEFSAPAEVLNYYLLPGPTLPDVLRQYTALTGRMPLPALWTLGFHQCRWGYASEADIRAVAGELRARQIPADGIWMDIDYMDGYRVFTWDKKDFPHPKQMVADLKRDGFHPVTIVDPGVKVDKGYFMYDEGRAGGHFVKHRNGKEYNGSVWPGRSAFPDFHRAEAREWWAGHVRQWLADWGLSGLWNDMNEPATKDMSGPVMDALHGGLPHASARNTYALQMARATYDGLLAHDPDSRPFILTRAAFSGAQRVAALWGGDNHAVWEHLAASLPLLMNLGLSGMPFVGVDIGGFGGDSVSGELLARWTQAGAFYPFCRNHAAAGTRPHEPWQFGPQVEAICRKYLGLRYQLLPYFSALFREASLTGAPIMRPLVWHYSKDPATFNLNDQFMLGPDLLIAPILAPGLMARSVYLPKGRWYRWRVGQASSLAEAIGRAGSPSHIVADAPLDELPIFVRGGAIIPAWPLAQYTGAIDRSDVTLHLWPGKGRLDFYEDDGATRAYERGDYRLTRFKMKADSKKVTLSWGAAEGGYSNERRDWKFVAHGLTKATARLDGDPVAIRRGLIQIRDDGRGHQLTVIPA
jgi:alpha-glucosidase